MSMIDLTCTDCMKTIRMDEVEIAARTKLARLCDDCRRNRADHHIPPDAIQPPMLGNYRTMVELQWMITPKDLEYVAIGDDEEDFARRSLFAVRSVLQLVAGSGHNLSPIGHYHLRLSDHKNGLKRCVGPAAKDHRAHGFVRLYHDALNLIAGLALDLDRIAREGLGVARDALDPDEDVDLPGIPQIDYSMVHSALAVGRRQGWPVDPRLDDKVREAETNTIPLSEEEARRRMKAAELFSGNGGI